MTKDLLSVLDPKASPDVTDIEVLSEESFETTVYPFEPHISPALA